MMPQLDSPVKSAFIGRDSRQPHMTLHSTKAGMRRITPV